MTDAIVTAGAAAAAASGIRHIGAPVMRAGQPQPISPVVTVDDRWVFVAGLVPMRDGRPAAGDIAGQTHAVIDMLEAALQTAGCGLAQVVKTTVWLTDAADYPAFNAAYAARFGHTHAPARSTVIAGLIAPVRVEIEAMAVKPATAN